MPSTSQKVVQYSQHYNNLNWCCYSMILCSVVMDMRYYMKYVGSSETDLWKKNIPLFYTAFQRNRFYCRRLLPFEAGPTGFLYWQCWDVRLYNTTCSSTHLFLGLPIRDKASKSSSTQELFSLYSRNLSVWTVYYSVLPHNPLTYHISRFNDLQYFNIPFSRLVKQ